MYKLILLVLGLSFSISNYASARADFLRANGDSPCASGSFVTVKEARQVTQTLCRQLNTWDIARLANGASLSGPGYGCEIKRKDDRKLGHSLCKRNPAFFTMSGDAKAYSRVCANQNAVLVNMLEYQANKTQACNRMGQWYIARIEGGASVDGPGYSCKSRKGDSRDLGHSLCAKYTYSRPSAGASCRPGFKLATPNQVRRSNSAACSKLGQWDIVRLAGGGSMDGPGYGCKVRLKDTRPLGHSLCVPMK